MTLFFHEIKQNRKSMFIWGICIGLVCLGCLCMYGSLEEQMGQMKDMFSQMGSITEAVGLDRVGLDTMEGYYATEIAIMFGLGSAMYAAITGVSMLAKEEEGHTSEFLNTLPMGRVQIVIRKYVAIVALIVCFNAICIVCSVIGFLVMGKEIDAELFICYHLLALLMQLEIAGICFMISAVSRKKIMGPALGLVILLYTADIMCRLVPAIENVKYITPFYYSNAADIFSKTDMSIASLVTGIMITVLTPVFAGIFYKSKDLT